MTIEYAESFFAWDVLSWIFLVTLLAISIVLIDLLFFSKLQTESDIKETEERSTFRKICYFLIFLKFSKSEKYKHRPKVVQWSIELFPVLLLVLVFRGFIFEPFRVPSNSMMPTLLTGDFILVNKFDYGLRLPILNSKIIDFSYSGANLSESVGPNKEIMGTLDKESICITPLSIVIAKSNLFPRQATKAGDARFDSYSGKREYGINS